ncbi:MAG: GntR family transcriptional regulator [Clostridia bacterium]|nr:GntR family transcriptional regulator [Clostridia bacterium]MBQ7086862.1 GntR family transcriptional regulator [Clostridia bacterium]MBQ7093205.1 GntR family transcriptional regulator [Clostridia bacterium]
MINKNSSVPMYEQIVQILKKEILEHKYPEGGSIGTHEDLVKRFGVSLITVRRAVLILQKEGLVVIRQGKGTFVKTKAVSDDLSTLTVVNNILKHKDPAPKVVVKSIGLIKTPPYFDASLKKELGDECVRIVRAHMLDGVVYGYAKMYLPEEYGSLITQSDVENHSIYEIYQNKFGVKLGKGIQKISADKATKTLADAMDIAPNTPVMCIERKSYSADKELIEYMELYYEHSQYYFQVEMDLTV